MLKRCELTDQKYLELKKYCKKKKIIFLCTPYSVNKANFLINLGEKEIKIASTDSTNHILINHILKKKIKVIISTGVTSLEEIDKIMRFINFEKNKKLITLMHCTSYYPADEKILNLKTIKFLKDKYKINIGYSDHSSSELTGALAVMLGANVIEKHITLSKKMWGPDHKASLEYKEFKRYIKNIRFADKACGQYKKILSKKELKVKKQMQKSLFYKKNLLINERLKLIHIDIKRPGLGLSPLNISKIIGKKLAKNVKGNNKIKFSDFKS